MTTSQEYSNTPTARLIRELRAAKKAGIEMPVELPTESLSPAEILQQSQLLFKFQKQMAKQATAAEIQKQQRLVVAAEAVVEKRREEKRKADCGSSSEWHAEGLRQFQAVKNLIWAEGESARKRAASARAEQLRQKRLETTAAMSRAEATRRAARTTAKAARDALYMKNPQAMAKHLARAAKRSAGPQTTA